MRRERRGWGDQLTGLNIIRQSFPGLNAFSGSSRFHGGHLLSGRQSGITAMGTHPEGCLSPVKEMGIPGGMEERMAEKDEGESLRPFGCC